MTPESILRLLNNCKNRLKRHCDIERMRRGSCSRLGSAKESCQRPVLLRNPQGLLRRVALRTFFNKHCTCHEPHLLSVVKHLLSVESITSKRKTTPQDILTHVPYIRTMLWRSGQSIMQSLQQVPAKHQQGAQSLAGSEHIVRVL